MGRERKIEFDILKGISILLVIIGHSRCVSPIYEFFNSFHVPLFFCISGYFFSLKGSVGGIFKMLQAVAATIRFGFGNNRLSMGVV